jgi:hypothetical protein
MKQRVEHETYMHVPSMHMDQNWHYSRLGSRLGSRLEGN